MKDFILVILHPVIAKKNKYDYTKGKFSFLFFKSFFILSLNNFAKGRCFMKQILIPYAQDALVGTPRPHYLVGKAIIHLLDGNKIKFTGKALFPLSD